MSLIQFADEPCVLCGKPGAAVIADPGILMRSDDPETSEPWRKVTVGDIVCHSHVVRGYNSRDVHLN